MRFKDASKIHEAVEMMRLANYPVARNRAKVNDLFNGNQPWSESDRLANKIFTNVNPLFGTRIAHTARQNLNNAFCKPGRYFDVRLDTGPSHKRREWGEIISTEINRILKREQQMADMWDATNAQVVLHGVGPVWWSGRENPMPREVGIEDVLVPAQTLLNFSNLEFFGIYRQWTYAELWDMTHGRATDPGWNMPMVKQLLASLAEQPLQSTIMGQRWLMPEKLAEDLKENAGIFMTSAAPTIFVWDFYFRDYDEDKDEDRWERRVVLDYMQMQPEALRSAISDDAKSQFLYEKKGVYSKALGEMIHFQIGNCSNVAPFRYYSVRSLGFLLFAVCQLQNRLYCRFADSVFENMLQYFRNVGEDDRERLEKVDLWHMGIVPDGLSFVTATERHQVNENQLSMMMAMNKQLMGESSATWMPEIDTGTEKEQTLGEAKIRLQTSASLSNALLNQSYERATKLYREQCRRFCLTDSRNRLVKEFRRRVLSQGVPEDVLDASNWDIEPERVLGGGNKALEALQAEKLMAVRAAMDPDAQREVLHIYVETHTDDPKLAQRLVPMGEKPISEATQLATLAIGTLMQGLPVVQKRGFNEIDYVQTMLRLTTLIVEQIQGLQQTPGTLPIQMQKVGGLANALQHTQDHLNVLASDPGEKERVRQFEEELARQLSAVDALAQQINEQLQAEQPQGDEESQKAMAKIQAMMIEAQSRAKIQEANAQQKQAHKDMQWSAENQRRNATTAEEIQRKRAQTIADVESNLMRTRADIEALDLTTKAEIERPSPSAKNE